VTLVELFLTLLIIIAGLLLLIFITLIRVLNQLTRITRAVQGRLGEDANDSGRQLNPPGNSGLGV